jgi:glycosyltransferase involved in cell wall biosynthesis
MSQLSIVIPCYNEVDNLQALVKRCLEVLHENADTEIILVDNGSKDNTPQLMQQLLAAAGLDRLRSHQVQENKGYGYGILQGLEVAASNVLCWTHADLQTDITDCIKAYNIWNEKKDPQLVVKGKRRGRNFFDTFFTQAMQWYVLYKLRININDINGQPKLFSKTFFDGIKSRAPYDFSLDLYLLINAKRKGKLIDFPVYFHNRVAGEAKGGGSGGMKLKIKLLKRTAAYINELKKQL